MKLDKEIQKQFNILMAAMAIAKEELQVYADEIRKNDYDSDKEKQEVVDNVNEQFDTISSAISVATNWAEQVQDTKHTYGGWCADDVINIAINLGYDIPDTVADALMQKIVSKDCAVNWDTIETVIEHDLYEFGLKKYFVGVPEMQVNYEF